MLARARIQPGDTVLDVGTGDGLVGIGALPLVGEGGHVVFNDVSRELLEACRLRVSRLAPEAGTSFLLGRAEGLFDVAAASIDVVTTRSVLMHLEDRPAAFSEFFRVLRPGGRLSCFESLASRVEEPMNLYRGYDISPVRELIDRVRALGARPAPLATAPMVDFDDADLLRWAQVTGFAHVHVTVELDCRTPSPMRSWEFFYNTPTHPGIPPLAREAEAALSEEEVARLCAHLRPLVEGGQGVKRQAIAFLTATR